MAVLQFLSIPIPVNSGGRHVGSTDFRGQEKRRYAKGSSLFLRAENQDSLRRPDGTSGIAWRASPLCPEIWRHGTRRSRLEAFRRPRAPLRATFGRPLAGEAF